MFDVLQALVLLLCFLKVAKCERWEANLPVHYETNNSAFFLKDEGTVNAANVKGGSLYSSQLVGFADSRRTPIGAAYGPFRVEQRPPQPDVSVQLFDSVVTINQPRVAGVFTLSHHRGRENASPPCYQLVALYGNNKSTASCRPEGPTGSCYVEVPVPLTHWERAARTGHNSLKIYYYPAEGTCSRLTGNLIMESSLAMKYVDEMLLEDVGPENPGLIREDQLVWIKVPTQPLAPNSRFLVPVFLSENVTFPEFFIRTRTRKGIRFVGAKVNDRKNWQLNTVITKQESKAGVHVYSTSIGKQPSSDRPVFTFEFEVENNTEQQQPHQETINFKIGYRMEGDRVHSTRLVANVDVTRSSNLKSIVTEIQHDTIVNMAILNNVRISQPIKVISIDSQGRMEYIMDGLLCSSLNSSVLKVDGNCEAVYVDGSEITGLQRVGIQITYQDISTIRYFSVWVPQIPLQIELSDSQLSPIKGWRIPMDTNGQKRSKITRCQPQYQTSNIEVYTHFYTYNKSGAKKYLFDSKTLLRVTEEILGQLHVSNASVAKVMDGKVVALTQGKSDIKVMSAAGPEELGSTPVEVSDQRVSIQALDIGLVTGMTLLMQEATYDRVYTILTRAHRRMLAKYQEGMVEAVVTYSDGVSVSLDSLHRSHYTLNVASSTPSVVLATPGATTKAKVIALGEGQAQLQAQLRTAKECQRARKLLPLASTFLRFNNTFSPAGHLGRLMQGDQRPPSTQMENSASSLGAAGQHHFLPGEVASVDMGYINSDFDPADLADDLGEGSQTGGNRPHFPLDQIPGLGDLGGGEPKDDSPDPKINYTRPVESPPPVQSPARLSPLYISLYTILGVMCFAGLIGFTHCLLSATYYKKKHGLAAKSKTVCVSDWVWLSNKPHGHQDQYSPQPPESIPLRAVCPGCRLEVGEAPPDDGPEGDGNEDYPDPDSAIQSGGSNSNLSSRTPSTVIYVNPTGNDGESVSSGSRSTLVSQDSIGDLHAVLDVMKQGDGDFSQQTSTYA